MPAKFPLWPFLAAAYDAIVASAASNALFLGSNDVFISTNIATSFICTPLDDNVRPNELATVSLLNDGGYPTT